LASKEDTLDKQWNDAWNALSPLRQTWDEKEQALLAQTSDSFSGNITYARVTDAALSTLAFERQARVAAQLPSGRVTSQSVRDEAAAKLAGVVLNRYIIPNADSQHPMLIKLRLWGVYASVYGSMPMFYDYRVDDRYIGPECYLTDPRCFAIQPGFSSTQDAEYAFISTIVSHNYIKDIISREKTTWNRAALKDILKEAEANDAKPGRDEDIQKNSQVERQRYDKSQAKNRIEFVTKYESGNSGHWITFAPDFDNKIVRDIPNPHKSGRIPIIMRHCFPLLNSIFGLGDYERGMRIQKAKDSLTNLFLEGAKNRIFPPLMIDTSKVTLSTIKNQANGRWIVQDMERGVRPVNYGNQAMGEFQSTWGSLQSMLMNQFGTTDTTLSKDDTGNPAFGKTPQAIAALQQRQNSRDTWDMFMHEQATQELFEGMINLLTVKMEKPVNFSVFEEDMKQIKDEFGENGLKAFSDGKTGVMTATKDQLKAKGPVGYQYLIDPNSSLSQNAQEQFQALSEVWTITHSNPEVVQSLQQNGFKYDEGEHLKSLFVAAGVTDWDKILQQQDQTQQQQDMGQPGQPPVDPQMLQAMMQQQRKSPAEMINYKDAPPDIKAQMEQQAGLQPSQTHQGEMAATGANQANRFAAAQGVAQTQPPQQPNFQDPEIAALAQHLMGGGQ
jgi:hypothetical protein